MLVYVHVDEIVYMPFIYYRRILEHMENNTAKHFVLQLGSIISLYLSVSFILVLLFAIINLLYPDATEGYYVLESASQNVRLGIAMLIVFFPVFLYLTRTVNTLRRKESQSTYLGLTKWLMYFSLLIGGGVLLGDVVALILGFLNGELTTRFLFKAAALFIIVGAAFYYYLQDARGYWLTKEKSSVVYAGGMTAIVVGSIILGFFHIETPTEVREMKLDETQIQDFRDIQWKIEEVLNTSSSSLPTSLTELYGAFDAPKAPEDRDAYVYEVTDTGFKLCGQFSRDSQELSDPYSKPYIDPTMHIKNAENWSYKEGFYCFERIIK
jgi:hypothetical protein